MPYCYAKNPLLCLSFQMGQFLTKKKYSAHEHPMLNRTSNGERNAFIIGSFEMQCDNMTSPQTH
ncbi:hypothetical protein T08_12318 [Trichinella sp. T8]|nr:hypothetical protein T08_12318 [Trichinella sp. T8]